MLQAIVVLLGGFWPTLTAVPSGSEKETRGRPDQISVCQLLENPSVFDGKTVVVSGWIHWDRESFALEGKECSNTLRTGEYEWIRAICLKVSDEPAKPLQRSRELFYELFKLYQWQIVGGEVRIYASLFGKVQSRQKYEAHPLGGGRYLPNGYCHLRQFPAIIQYSGVDQIIVYYLPKPSTFHDILQSHPAGQEPGQRQDQ